jgi:hypothetical protein
MSRLDATFAGITLCVVVALIALVLNGIPDWLDSWQADAGYTEEQLARVETTCDARVGLRFEPGSDRYVELYRRCEQVERARIDPDPLLK